MLKENLAKVEENIQAACDRAGRKREEVTLIAVSKTKPVEMLQEAYDLGVRINGENKAPSFFAYSSAVRSMSSASGAPEAENWISKPPVPRKMASP